MDKIATPPTMGNTFERTLYVACALALFACATPKAPEATKLEALTATSAPLAAATAPCVYPDTDQRAPVWICNKLPAGIEIGAVSIAEHTSEGAELMRDLAVESARKCLVENFKAHAEQRVKNYLSAGTGDADKIQRVATNVAHAISEKTLYGSRLIKSHIGPKKRLYVLLGMDAERVAIEIDKALRTDMEINGDAWQQVRLLKSLDELAEEISQKNQPSSRRDNLLGGSQRGDY